MKEDKSEQEQQEGQNPQRNIPEECAAQIRGENPPQEHHLPQGVNTPISRASLGRINWRMEGRETESERSSILTSHGKRKHTKQPTKVSVTSVQDVSQVPGTSTSSTVATSATGKHILSTVRCQRETVSPTDSPLHKRHKIHSDEISASKLVIEISSSSDSASSPEEQKLSSPQSDTSAGGDFHEETKEVTKESAEMYTKQQQLDSRMIKPASPIQEASSSGGSLETSGTSCQGSSSTPEKLTCRLPINESTRAALTLYTLGNQNVKEGEESSDILEPQVSDGTPVENPECHQVVQSSMPFGIPVKEGKEKSLDSILMPPPDMRIESSTPPKKKKNEVLKENKRESETWWCIDSITFYPPDQLQHRFRPSDRANRANWNITSYPRNFSSNQPRSLQFPSGSHDPCPEPPEVEPAEEDEGFVGRPSKYGTSKRVLGLVPHIGNITLTSILWTEPSPNEVFCRGIKRCKSCGMPQGLFTRLPITIKLLWFNSLDETQMPYTETVECAFPVDIWGTASFLKRQDSNVGWILDSKILDIDLMLLNYAEAQDYRSKTSESKSAEGRSFKRKTSQSESDSSEGES